MSFNDLVESIQVMQMQQNLLLQNQKNLQQLRQSQQTRIDMMDHLYKDCLNPRGYSQEEIDNFFSLRFQDINNAYNYKGDIQLKLLEILLEHGKSWEDFFQTLKDSLIGLDHFAWVNIKFPNGYSLQIGMIDGEVKVSVIDSNGRWIGFRSLGIGETPINLAKEGGMFEIVDPVSLAIKTKIKRAEKIARMLIAVDGDSQLQTTMRKTTNPDLYLENLISGISSALEAANHVGLDEDTVVEICRDINPDPSPFIDKYGEIVYKNWKEKGEFTTVRLKLGEGLTAAELYGLEGDTVTIVTGKDTSGNWILGQKTLKEDGILANTEHLDYILTDTRVDIKYKDGEVGGNYISLYSLLRHPKLFNYILSGKVSLSIQSSGSVNDFIKMTQKTKSISEIRENTKKVSKNVADFAFTSIKAIEFINNDKLDTYRDKSSIIKRIIKNNHIDLHGGADYWTTIVMVGRCIQQYYPGMGTAFVNLMSPLIEQKGTGSEIPLSKWVQNKYGVSKTIWTLEYSDIVDAIGALPGGKGDTDKLWLNIDSGFIDRRTLANSMLKWIELANQFRTPAQGQYKEITNYLQNLNEFITDNEFIPGSGPTTRINEMVTTTPSLPEALNLDRLTRWLSIPFDLLAKANEMFSSKANNDKFSDMQGLPSDSTFDKYIRFNKPADYREQFMNWHTAQIYTWNKDKYSIGNQRYIRSALWNNLDNVPLIRIAKTKTWTAYKKAGLYYLNSKNSIRGSESVKSEISYLDHPNDLKSWKTSKFERNGNQPVTQRAKPEKRHIKSRLAVDYEYDLFSIGHPLNPFTNAFVIDFWGEIIREATKKSVGTYRGRVTYEDYISHINNIKDNAVLSHLRTYLGFYGKGNYGNVLNPDMDASDFSNLFNQDSEFRDVVVAAMFPNLKGCWADTYIEFNNLGKMLKFQIEFLGKDAGIYKKVKQNDLKFGFGPDNIPTLYVCDNDAAKLKYLKDHAEIGFSSPILTKTEYFALMKAWWYAYAEMSIDGEFRDRFDFTGFITNLAARANPTARTTNWNIDYDIALKIMGSFGYGVDQYNIGHRFTGNAADDTLGNHFGLCEWTCQVKGSTDIKFKYKTASPYIGLDFLDYFYMSWIPDSNVYIQFTKLKPTWA